MPNEPQKLKEQLSHETVDMRTTIREKSLSRIESALASYTYPRVGKLLYGTLETWKLGFMCDQDPDRELLFWVRVSLAVEKLPTLPPEEVMSALVAQSLNQDDVPDATIRSVWESITDEEMEAAVGAACAAAELSPQQIEVWEDEDGCIRLRDSVQQP